MLIVMILKLTVLHSAYRTFSMYNSILLFPCFVLVYCGFLTFLRPYGQRQQGMSAARARATRVPVGQNLVCRPSAGIPTAKWQIEAAPMNSWPSKYSRQLSVWAFECLNVESS